jgi:MFS family permease
MFEGTPDLAWRAMFWLGAVPALFTLWIRKNVPESPLWLERQRRLAEARAAGTPIHEPRVSLVAIFRRDLIGTTIQTSALLGAFMCSFYSIGFWYPTLLREAGRSALPYLVAFNVGAIIGTASWGRLSETALGRRGAVTLTALLGVTAIPLYLGVDAPGTLWIGAFLMGACGCGIWGMAPAYLSERFPTAVRGVGPGFSYHAGAAIGSLAPVVIGTMQDRGVALASAMGGAILVSGLLAATLIWLGPETRGRELT